MSFGLAPGNGATRRELLDRELRPLERAPLPEGLAQFSPSEQLVLDHQRVLVALKTAGRGSAPDLSGTRYEHLRVLMDDDDLWPLFAFVKPLPPRRSLNQLLL